MRHSSDESLVIDTRSTPPMMICRCEGSRARDNADMIATALNEYTKIINSFTEEKPIEYIKEKECSNTSS